VTSLWRKALGHLSRMSDDRLLKQLLFGELQRIQPWCCLTSRPLTLVIVGILSAKIGCIGCNYLVWEVMIEQLCC